MRNQDKWSTVLGGHDRIFLFPAIDDGSPYERDKSRCALPDSANCVASETVSPFNGALHSQSGPTILAGFRFCIDSARLPFHTWL
jgi:hypothetical protein